METITVNGYSDRLNQRRQQLLTTLRHLDAQQQEVEGNTDWIDEAACDSRIALLDSLRHDYQEELTGVDRALERIANRQYGNCAACHQAIDAQRLESLPAAEFCFSCENFREEFESYAA